MNKQKVTINGKFTLDEFRDIFASLSYEGYSVTANRGDGEWVISGEKEIAPNFRITTTPQVYGNAGIYTDSENQ